MYVIKRYACMLIIHVLLNNTKFGAFREIRISRATSDGRREIELNSGSLPLIPGGLATLVTTQTINRYAYAPCYATAVVFVIIFKPFFLKAFYLKSHQLPFRAIFLQKKESGHFIIPIRSKKSPLPKEACMR